jgi:hypothetical protein
MSDPVTDLLAVVEGMGGRLSVAQGAIEYEGPLAPLTPRVREQIRAHRAALVRRLTPPRIAELLAHLAAHGVWVGLEDGGRPRLHAHTGADLDGVDAGVIDQLHDRVEELVAFLGKTEDELTAKELAALGYRQTLPDEVLDEVFADRDGRQVLAAMCATERAAGLRRDHSPRPAPRPKTSKRRTRTVPSAAGASPGARQAQATFW